MNKTITPLSLIDFVLREENRFQNDLGIELRSSTPEKVFMGHVLKNEEDHYISLLSKGLHAEKFISYFKLNSLKDLKVIAPKQLWDAYLDGKGLLRCGMGDGHELDFSINNGQSEVHFRALGYAEQTGVLIDTVEKAEDYLLIYVESTHSLFFRPSEF